MKKNYQLKAIFLLFIFLITFFVISSNVSAQNCSGGPDDGQGCSEGGSLLNGCNWVCNNSAPPGTVLKPPSCCETLAQTGDPTVCCFDARRRCTIQQCSSIPEGVRKERCGQLWEVGGYCNDPPTPTAPPIVLPTKKPTIVPSAVPPQPTKKLFSQLQS